jgi:hypothetical protein
MITHLGEKVGRAAMNGLELGRQDRAELGRRGIALVTTLLVVLVAGALVTGAIILGSNHLLLNRHWSRQGALGALADAGLEVSWSRLNGDPSLFPDSGFVALEAGVPVVDASGQEIRGVERWTYVGPSEATPGWGGLSGSIVSVVTDRAGGMVIRRRQILRESFARFAYFSNTEGGDAFFAGSNHIWGPVHTNDRLRLNTAGVVFHEEVSSTRGVHQPGLGTFKKGFQERSPAISLPAMTELGHMRKWALRGHTYLEAPDEGAGSPTTVRIQFIAVDLNGDGDKRDADEGFFRVYRSNDSRWLLAEPQPREVCRQEGGRVRCDSLVDLVGSRNCGDYHEGVFIPAPDHDPSLHEHDGLAALEASTARCYLGGADEIWNGFVADDGKGRWLPWTGPVRAPLRAARPSDAEFLWPLSRGNNPDFEGVIFVDGNVVLSGEIRGRVTVAAAGDIIIGDDLTYVTDPSVGSCEDMAGFFSEGSVVLSNNAINAAWRPTGMEAFRSYDETTAEFLHGVVLALDNFEAEELGSGSAWSEACEGTPAGRGCLYLTGGVIQDTPGLLGLADGHGYLQRYSYDRCAATRPPPRFPTTGVLVKGQYYQVDPSGFDVEEYFSSIAPWNRSDAGK